MLEPILFYFYFGTMEYNVNESIKKKWHNNDYKCKQSHIKKGHPRSLILRPP